MNLIGRIWQSSLGKKYVMAITGALLFLFLIGHLLGNLQVFLPKEKINAYGHFLHTNPALLWTARLGLLVCAGLHVLAAVRLTAQNRAARGAGYEGNPAPTAASYASRTMLMSGLIVAAFVFYHLAHFTWQIPGINLIGKDFESGEFLTTLPDGHQAMDVHKMMVSGFQSGIVALFYLAGLGLLCLHLSHGLMAMFQSLGLRNQAWAPVIACGARTVAAVIFLGYAAIPVALWLRLVDSR
jgi:succinate dehydrogenase / fumarate reductase cytochrome b subunit